MKYHALRLLCIIGLFVLQLTVSSSVSVVLIVGLLVNRMVSPRESYVLAAGAGLLLDLMHWRVFGVSSALMMLIFLKIAERALATRQFEESGLSGIVLASITGGILLSLSGVLHGPFSTWVGSLLLSIVLTTAWAVVLYVPIERIGVTYRRITAS